MRLRVAMLTGMLVALALPATTQACPVDHYTDLGQVYLDDDPTPYVYLEANGIDGLQRDNDGNVDGHCTHPNPDRWMF